MKQVKPNKERGITLIALILTIVILVLLASVAIKSLTGEESIIDASTEAVENYNIVSYREQVEVIARSSIQVKSAMGGEATIEDIANGLNNETTWVKEAFANTDSSINNEDVIVTTQEGYCFQVSYDNTYGAVFVEYIGRNNKDAFPNIIARYEKSIASIITKTSIESGSVEKLELIYRGEVLQTITDLSGELRLKVDSSGTGWYILKATSNKGKLRYAWIRVTNVTDRLTVPEIIFTPSSPDGEQDWYKTVPVGVEIKTESPSANEIHYIISGASTKDETIVQGKTAKDTIANLGRTTITAWAEDGKGFQSEVITKVIKLDNEKPSITHKETSNKAQVGIWYKDNVTVEIEGNDNHSGIANYKYMVEGEHSNFIDQNMGQKLSVQKEGETRIKAKTVDICRK